MHDKYYCPDYRLEPPENEEPAYICPVCGEEVWDESWIYFYKGQLVGCDNCLERRHPSVDKFGG